MSRYYAECLKKIENAIERGETEKARELLEEELSMPFIPEPYHTQFEKLYRDMPKREGSSQFYEDFDELIEGLKSKDERQTKALFSMQRMNLRMYLEDLRDLLLSSEIEDDLKKFILMLLLEQSISGVWQIRLKDEIHQFDLTSLSLPYDTKAYHQSYEKLKDRYESFDPSFLNLCIQELNILSYQRFPFSHEEINEKEIIQRVKRAFSY